MAAGNLQFFHGFFDWQFATGADLDIGNTKLALFLPGLTPNAAGQAVWADISGFELTHPGYTAGGSALTNPLVSVTGGVGKLDSDDWTRNFLGEPANPKWAVLYLDTAVGLLFKPLIGFIDLALGDASLAIPAGTTLTIATPAAGWCSWQQA